MIECEIKLKINDSNEIKEKLISLGFAESESLTECDTYFDTKANEIRSNDRALRIRETVNHTTGKRYCQLNFKDKKLDDKSMSRQEHETGIDSAETMFKILECLGYFPVSPRVIKNRTMLQTNHITACIDSVEGLGDYLELETIVDTEIQKENALKEIDCILNKLGYSLSDTTRTSYLTALQNLQKA